jgi:hypothetical protein
MKTTPLFNQMRQGFVLSLVSKAYSIGKTMAENRGFFF